VSACRVCVVSGNELSNRLFIDTYAQLFRDEVLHAQVFGVCFFVPPQGRRRRSVMVVPRFAGQFCIVYGVRIGFSSRKINPNGRVQSNLSRAQSPCTYMCIYIVISASRHLIRFFPMTRTTVLHNCLLIRALELLLLQKTRRPLGARAECMMCFFSWSSVRLTIFNLIKLLAIRAQWSDLL